MPRPSLAGLTRAAGHGIRASPVARPSPSFPRAAFALTSSPRLPITPAPIASPARPISATRSVSTSSDRRKGLMPETDDPQPTRPAESIVAVAPADLTDSEYHQLADEYLETLFSKFEEMQEERDGLDVEFSDGVMTIDAGSEIGTYVLNKQPPNKQLWLSSPRSGPKRYDWVVVGDGQNDKQGTAVGEWIYLRDRSRLDKLLLDELGVDLSSAASSSKE